MFASLSTRFRNIPRPGRVAVVLIAALMVMVAIVSLAGHALPGVKGLNGNAGKPLAGPLHAEGSKLVDADGDEVPLTGVNWFGFETGTFSPHGLWTRNWESMLDQMKTSGYNTIRLPYANELFRQTAPPTEGIDYGQNPDLKGLYGPDLMDCSVKESTDRQRMDLLAQSTEAARPTDES